MTLCTRLAAPFWWVTNTLFRYERLRLVTVRSRSPFDRWWWGESENERASRMSREEGQRLWAEKVNAARDRWQLPARRFSERW